MKNNYKIILMLLTTCTLQTTFSQQASFRIKVDSLYASLGCLKQNNISSGYLVVCGTDWDAASVTRIDSNLNVEWNKYYLNLYGSFYSHIEIMPDYDSGYYFVMIPVDNVYGKVNTPHLMRLDKFGNIITAKLFPFSNANGDDKSWKFSFCSVDKNTNSLYIAGSYSLYDDAGDYFFDFHSFFAKLDTNLNIVFSKETGTQPTPSVPVAIPVYSGDTLTSFLMGVSAHEGYVNYANSLVKIDTSGNVLWKKKYEGKGRITDIHQVGNNFFITYDEPYGNKFALRKISSNGNSLLYKIYSTASISNGTCYPYKIQRKDANHLLIAVIKRFNFNRHALLLETNLQGVITNALYSVDTSYIFAEMDTANIAVLLLSSSYTGAPGSISHVEVEKQYFDSTVCGFIPVTLPDSNALIIDSTSFPVTQNFPITLNSASITSYTFANLVTQLCNTTGIDNTFSSQKETVIVFPNPFADKLIITTSSNAIREKAEIKIFDITGKEILHTKALDKETKINTAHLTPGFYLVNYREENKSVNKKVIKF